MVREMVFTVHNKQRGDREMRWDKAFNAFFAAVWFIVFVAVLIEQEPISWFTYALALLLLFIHEVKELVRDIAV